MKNFLLSLSLLSIVILTGCSTSRKMNKPEAKIDDGNKNEVTIKKKVPSPSTDTKDAMPEDLVTFAETLLGTKYKYGSESPERGFDCSGFVNYVFKHFNQSVPRITIDFTNAGQEVPIAESQPGDIILFTGRDAKSGVVGHIGIITENNNGDVKFIHASTSRGVVISGMNSYFLPRFVKVTRFFPEGR
jgi:cell wall-associated NlpC family hydrolase